ncbi:hypothetical protein GQ600_22385 [Phytophthora cactorum]|nr:hypothetical protein GQ600_22385 [Phytophthora cactorum]
MLTRSRSKASKQPVFIDDKWNDAYIQTKDEQIDAMLAADASQRGWDELEEENSESEDADSDEDAWHSDSDESEDNDEDWLERPQQLPEWSFTQRWVAGGGLLPNVGWTLAVVGVAPMLLYLSLPRSDQQLWPLQSPRLAGTLSKVLLNLLTLAVVGVALYGVSCSVESMTATNVLNWRQLELKSPVECGERLLQGGREFVKEAMERYLRLDDDIWTLVKSLDAPVTLVLLIAASYVAFNVVTEVKMQQRAAVEIFSLDPTFAFVNESIFVAIDGQNLEEGGSVAWAPYWGGVNEYVPCYLSAKETASAVIVDGEIQPSEAFQCFESIRLRVKDQKSVPGWSLNQHQQEEEPFPTEKHEL